MPSNGNVPDPDNEVSVDDVIASLQRQVANQSLEIAKVEAMNAKIARLASEQQQIIEALSKKVQELESEVPENV